MATVEHPANGLLCRLATGCPTVRSHKINLNHSLGFGDLQADKAPT